MPNSVDVSMILLIITHDDKMEEFDEELLHFDWERTLM
jgi:hypothetical protein